MNLDFDIKKIFFGILCLTTAYFYNSYVNLTKDLPSPTFDLTEQWRTVDPHDSTSSQINSFNISIPHEEIKNLQKRLDEFLISHQVTEPLENINFEYGFNSKKLKQVANYWRHEYLPNWKKREIFLNKFPQFTTHVQGLKIHFIHVKPTIDNDTKVFPILLLHGWPTCARDFYELIPLLSTHSASGNIAFEIVAPNLPGFGFSESAQKRGLGPEKMAVVVNNLMKRLNIQRYYVHGGDWGALIASHISALFPDNVLGLHSNFLTVRTVTSVIKTAIASFFPTYFIEDSKHIDWVYQHLSISPLQHLIFLLEESGYFHLQSTKPDTIGIALNQNPIGLAAYILEKVSTGTNRNYRHQQDGGFENHFSLDTLLDNIMIYYLTNSITTSMRIYKEGINSRQTGIDGVEVSVPVGVSYFKNDIVHHFPFLMKEKFKNIVHVSFHEKGGHFIALEMPIVLYQDILDFVRKTLKNI